MPKATLIPQAARCDFPQTAFRPGRGSLWPAPVRRGCPGASSLHTEIPGGARASDALGDTQPDQRQCWEGLHGRGFPNPWIPREGKGAQHPHLGRLGFWEFALRGVVTPEKGVYKGRTLTCPPSSNEPTWENHAREQNQVGMTTVGPLEVKT